MNAAHTVDDAEKRAAMEKCCKAPFVRASRGAQLPALYLRDGTGRAPPRCTSTDCRRGDGAAELLFDRRRLGVRRARAAAKLDRVYADELTEAKVRIEVPKGSYVPRFVPVERPLLHASGLTPPDRGSIV